MRSSKEKRRSVPDFIRRGLRQGLGVGALVAIGYEIVEPYGESSKTADQWLTCFKWAAISLIVLTAPVLGKVTEVAFERTIGTIAGGALGLVTVLLGREMMQVTDQAFTAIVSGLVGFGAVVAGYRLKMEYAGKLLAMTFILVVIGADGRADAFLVAVTRCSGILLGVALSVVLAVVIFPKSASHQATDSLAAALEGLERLCGIAWNSPHLADELGEGGDTQGSSGNLYLPLEGETGAAARSGSSKIAREAREAECERVLMDVYNRLSKADEFLPLAKRERYVLTFRGRWCFLPAIPFVRSSDWKLPEKPMRDLATAVRKVSRVLWALHVTFQEGFEEEVMSVLRRRYPPGMMSELQAACQASLSDLKAAFPDDTILANTSLQRFLQAVKDLIRISDEQRRFVMRVLVSQESMETFGDPNSMFMQATSISQFGGAPVAGKQGPASSLSIQADASEQQLQASGTRPSGSETPAAKPQMPSWMTDSPGDAIEFADLTSPTVTAAKVDVFPQTSAGYISKIRWFSFQFIMQQLADELEEMHRAEAIVLKMLPNALKARHA